MWPIEYADLKRIEDLLVCGICYEYMEASVITTCSHNYCSLCIRKYLHYKSQCPACFCETFEKDLRKNKVLDEIISYFLRVKEKLQKCLQGQINIVEKKRESNSLDTSTGSPVIKDSPLNKKGGKAEEETPLKNNKSPSGVKSVQKNFSSPSTSGNPKISLFFTPKSRKAEPNAEDIKTVTCPVCKVEVSDKNINKHLDDCLKRETIIEPPKTEQVKRKPLPKLVISLMKDTVIRKKLKELGLSSQGDRKTLESRLQRYTILYNAECDKSDPRPVPDLLKQCEEEENNEKKANKLTSSAHRLQVNRNTEQNRIDDERKKYLEAHKHSFQNLISMIKTTTTVKKPSVRRSLIDQNTSSSTDVPIKRQAITTETINKIEDTASNDFQPLHYDDIDIQNSDSDTSCPLQTYSSSDPMKFINVELSPVCKEDSPSPGKKSESDASYISNTPNEICVTPKGRVSLQRRIPIISKEEIEKIESLEKCSPEIDRSRGIKDEQTDNERPASILQDLVCDMSSNDSCDYRYNGGRTCSELNEFVKDTLSGLPNPEKENINSPVLGGRRCLRKRSHDSVLSNHKVVPGTKKRNVRKARNVCLSEAEESNNEETVVAVLHDNENSKPWRATRSRRNETAGSAVEETVLRKSGRTRHKNKLVLQ